MDVDKLLINRLCKNTVRGVARLTWHLKSLAVEC